MKIITSTLNQTIEPFFFEIAMSRVILLSCCLFDANRFILVGNPLVGKPRSRLAVRPGFLNSFFTILSTHFESITVYWLRRLKL